MTPESQTFDTMDRSFIDAPSAIFVITLMKNCIHE